MKKLLLILLVTLLTSSLSNVFGQGTKWTPWPNETYTYSIGAIGSDGTANNLTYTWWVSTSTTSTDPSDAGTITPYTVVSGSGTKDFQVQWGYDVYTVANSNGGSVYLFVKVEDNAGGCLNFAYKTITPSNNLNLVVWDVTGAPDETVASPTNNSGNQCPELLSTQAFNPNWDSYNAGYTYVRYRIDREYSNAEWSFDYAVTGAATTKGTVSVEAPSGTATISGNTVTVPAASNYVFINIPVDNTPGSGIDVTFTISNASDTNSASETGTQTDDASTHTIKIMPRIDSFN